MSVTFFPANVHNDDLSLNVANGNLIPCLDMLGIASDEQDYSGQIPVSNLESAWAKIQAHDPRNSLRADRQDGNFYHCGLRPEQLERYYTKLDQMLVFCIEQKRALNWA